MQHLFQKLRCLTVIIIGLMVSNVPLTSEAQVRLNDKDVERLMVNLHDDVKSFRGPFESALKKSSIRKTSQERDAKELAKRLETQTENMLHSFKDHKKADESFHSVSSTAQQIDNIVQQLGPQSIATSSWERVQGDLKALNAAFGVSTNASQPSTEVSCTQAVGEQRATRLAEECQVVSTATSGPCNARNSCKVVIDEIRRGCSLIGTGAPAFCSEYR
ncbi:hypothetical protein [Terriglobus tenax]|uniref:hypothetical protein n=1 Tax=Terriglobus tenax TaxID=1111115 RepID=UPI0021E0BB30|nr:hypothetical protein [Terriglobus tenax]